MADDLIICVLFVFFFRNDLGVLLAFIVAIEELYIMARVKI